MARILMGVLTERRDHLEVLVGLLAGEVRTCTSSAAAWARGSEPRSATRCPGRPPRAIVWSSRRGGSLERASTKLLRDLREIAVRGGQADEANGRIRQLAIRNARKPTL